MLGRTTCVLVLTHCHLLITESKLNTPRKYGVYNVPPWYTWLVIHSILNWDVDYRFGKIVT